MENVIVSLISFIGVITSVLLTFTINIYHNKIELIKVHSDFNRQLYSKRLDAYLEIFELVSGFVKIILRKGILYDDLIQFDEKYSALDSKYSLLFSHTTASSAQLIEKISSILDQDKPIAFSEDIKNDLLKKLIDVETTLKVEIGTYIYKDPTTIQELIKLPARKKEALLRLELYKVNKSYKKKI